MKIIKNISYTSTNNENQTLNIYLPDKQSFPVFIYFHGGGLVNGSKDHETLAQTLTKYGIALVSAEYRMYPNASYPEFIMDAASAIAWTKQHINEYGTCEKICIGGSSAGAYIAMMLCFDKQYLAQHEIAPDDIDMFIFDAGQQTVHFNVLKERGIDSRRILIDEAAPLYHICSERNYPPMFFIVSDNDIPNRIQETELTLSALKNLGHDMSKVKYKIMHGTHTSYDSDIDENGDTVSGKLYKDFILYHSCKETT